MIVNIKYIIDKVAGRKLGVTAAAANGAVEDRPADIGDSDGVYRGAGGGGYVGRVRRSGSRSGTAS